MELRLRPLIVDDFLLAACASSSSYHCSQSPRARPLLNKQRPALRLTIALCSMCAMFASTSAAAEQPITTRATHAGRAAKAIATAGRDTCARNHVALRLRVLDCLSHSTTISRYGVETCMIKMNGLAYGGRALGRAYVVFGGKGLPLLHLLDHLRRRLPIPLQMTTDSYNWLGAWALGKPKGQLDW